MYTVTVSSQKLRLEGKGPGRWVVTRNLRLTALWGGKVADKRGTFKRQLRMSNELSVLSLIPKTSCHPDTQWPETF